MSVSMHSVHFTLDDTVHDAPRKGVGRVVQVAGRIKD